MLTVEAARVAAARFTLYAATALVATEGSSSVVRGNHA